jgi:hypothetical protein
MWGVGSSGFTDTTVFLSTFCANSDAVTPVTPF